MCFFKDQVRVSTISFRGRGTRGGWGNPGTVEEYDNNSRFYIYLPPKQRKMSYHPRYLNHCMPQTEARKYSTMTLCVNSAKREILPKLLQFCIQIRRIPVTPFQSNFCTWKQSAYVVNWTNFLIYDRSGYLPKSQQTVQYWGIKTTYQYQR